MKFICFWGPGEGNIANNVMLMQRHMLALTVSRSGLLCFRTFSIVLYSEEHNVSETGFVSIRRREGGKHSFEAVRN
jgi:hypothetical protein